MCLAYSPGFLPLPARHERGGAGRTAVELRSADFSPPPLGTCKSAGSGMNSALQVRRNWLNSTAVLPSPLPAAQGEGIRGAVYSSYGLVRQSARQEAASRQSFVDIGSYLWLN